MNLLKETKRELREHNKKLSDVKWIGNTEYKIPLEAMRELFDHDYDSGYGSPKVAEDLIVVGADWWLERHEYDGSEWWEYKEIPTMPNDTREVGSVFASEELVGWVTLDDIEKGSVL